MHDGQNLFGLPESYGGKDWGIDDAILRLSRDPAFVAPIVVGVWNSADRWREYMPQKPAESGVMRTHVARFAGRPEHRLMSTRTSASWCTRSNRSSTRPTVRCPAASIRP